MIPEFIVPSFVNENDPDTIQQRMMRELPADIDTMPGGFPWDFTRPTALEKSELIQFQLVQTLKLMFPMWAWGDWLEYHAKEAGIHRREAGYASGKLTITGLPGTELPLGSVFVTPATDKSPSKEFIINSTYVIPSSSTLEVPIIAVNAGLNSNVAANTISLMSKPIKGVLTVINKEPITGGTMEEDDATLCLRIQEVNESEEESFIGNDSDYIRWSKEVTGVGSVVVDSEWDGPGTVKLVISDSNGRPANEKILEDVYRHIINPDNRLLRKAPIGAILTVIAPSTVELSYTGKIILLADSDLPTVIKAFQETLLTYYSIAKKEGMIKYTKICSILSETIGVGDFVEFKVNGSLNNITLAQDEYPETIIINFLV